MRSRVPFEGLTRRVAGVVVWSSRHAKATLLLILVVTLFLGFGATKLHTNVDVGDVLPRGDYNSTAAQLLTRDFKSSFTQQVTFQLHVDPTANKTFWNADNQQKLPNRDAQSPVDPNNITDEVYMRAMQQFSDFMLARTSLQNVVSAAELYSLVNWTVAGGYEGNPPAPDSAYHLPATDQSGSQRFAQVKTIADTAAATAAAIDAVCSPNWTTGVVLLLPDPDESLDLGELGRQALEARDAYLEWVEANPNRAYQVFSGDNKPTVIVDIPVANAHSSALVKEDFSRLLPIIGIFILVTLFLAFRNIGSMLIAFSSLAIGVIWTYGIEGYLGIALNGLNLTLMPLIMGVGIDYSIHVVNEFLEHKSHGFTNTRAFRDTGRRACFALFLASMITVGGLSVMVFSPSTLIAEYGILASIAIVSIFIVAMTFIPAALTVYPRTNKMGKSFKPSALMAITARGTTKVRYLALLFVVVASGWGYLASQDIGFESFGDPGKNYLASDPIRQEHERGLSWFYEEENTNIKANVIAFVGDVTTPQAHDYMRELEAALLNPPSSYEGVIISDTLRTIPFLMETWLTVKGGGAGAGLSILQGGVEYPQTQEAIEAEFDKLYDSPVRKLGVLFTNGPDKDYSMGVMTFSVRAASYEEAALAWEVVWSAIETVDAQHGRPDNLRVAFVGNSATNYLFVERQVPWLGYMGLASTVLLIVIAGLFFRSVRAVVTAALVSVATTAIWFGILPEVGIALAITLMLPLIFIISLGTDYVVHLIWSIQLVGDARQVFRTVGKAILFSFLTTIGPFVIFSDIQDLAVRKTMLATTIAIGTIFVVTMLVVPAMYAVGPKVKTVAAPTTRRDLPPLVARPRKREPLAAADTRR